MESMSIFFLDQWIWLWKWEKGYWNIGKTKIELCQKKEHSNSRKAQPPAWVHIHVWTLELEELCSFQVWGDLGHKLTRGQSESWASSEPEHALVGLQDQLQDSLICSKAHLAPLKYNSFWWEVQENKQHGCHNVTCLQFCLLIILFIKVKRLQLRDNEENSHKIKPLYRKKTSELINAIIKW